MLEEEGTQMHLLKHGFQVALGVKKLPAVAGDRRDAGSIPGWGRSTGGGQDNLLPYSCLENPHGQRSLEVTVHRVVKSWSQLKSLKTKRWNTGSWKDPCPSPWSACVPQLESLGATVKGPA